MERTTRTDLRQMVVVLNNLTLGEYNIGWAYGRPRVCKDNDSVNVSPRLPMGEMKTWLYAYMDGYRACCKDHNI